MGGLVSIVSYSRPSHMIIALVSQFHFYLPWGQRFQPGEGPSRGLLRDCTTSPINRFAALVCNNGQVKRLQNIAYQLGQEESKEMTRGKYLNILRKKNSS